MVCKTKNSDIIKLIQKLNEQRSTHSNQITTPNNNKKTPGGVGERGENWFIKLKVSGFEKKKKKSTIRHLREQKIMANTKGKNSSQKKSSLRISDDRLTRQRH